MKPETPLRPPTDVSKVHPILRQDAASIWGLKEGGCKKADHYDIQPQVSFFDGDGRLIVSVVANQGRDGALAIARIGTAMTEADVVVLHMDAHVTQSPVNPVTDKPWGPHEMQNLCDHEGACSTGLLTDCIVSQAIFRSDNHVEMVMRKYHGHEKAGGLHWATDTDVLIEDGNARSEGLIPDVLREAMADTTFAEMAATVPPPEGASEAVARWHRICAALKMMIGLNAVIAVIPNPPSEAQEVVAETLSQEATERFLSGPLGTLLAMLRMKWGLE